ncbi:MAG: ribose 5-phosphate isomerase B [Deferribacteres bacterium]|nr:ribose 5-phosphate isomerase B [candidate division KSB1 bacterium]MCB9503766.1 ribose 5-phosphate isomerase B [Deferribacteres bacterium]
MKISIASDHAGFELKKEIVAYLKKKPGIEIIDMGTDSEHHSVDYPEMAAKVARSLQKQESERGIILCGTGIGISISANKFKGIRAALCHDAYTARMSRAHNNANVLAMGGRTTGKEVAFDMVDIWLDTEFEGDRHQRRVDLIASFEQD